MDMSKKRDLMIAIETLCVRPGNAKQPNFYQAGEEVQVIIVTKELLDEHGIELEAV